MFRALSTAATGMESQQAKLDLVANNLANVNTAGFRKSRADFEDLLYETIRAPGTSSAAGQQVAVGVQIGHGSRLVATQTLFNQGQIQQTNNPLDLAIEGKGFFQVSQHDGTRAYTRAGTFKADSNGRVATANGDLLDPPLTIPAGTLKVTIGKDGTVSATMAGQTSATTLGKIKLVSFANPAGLNRKGHNLFAATSASGQPQSGSPGSNELGTLAQGMLEMSNVKVVEEMIELIVGQRAYEANSRVIKAADQMLRATAHLR